MDDQVAALRQVGVNAGALHSELDPAEARSVTRDLIEQQLDLLYVSPERLLANGTLDRLIAPADRAARDRRGALRLANGAMSSGRNTARSPACRSISRACRASR